MDSEKLKEKIFEIVPEAILEENKQFLTFLIPPDKLKTLTIYLKEDKDLDFDYLFCLSGVDWGTELGVVYHLTSTSLNHSVELKVKTDNRETPEFDTVSDLWMTADFMEREVWDLFGIRFAGHKDMRRIFLEEDWVGYPMRKDYTDEVNIVEL
ncbi:MAG: NADH-quinone oxidoreductase subunit C [Bacteroidia bacterium]|nr:NADH-quinone oxidoreductase subunit C [Bacteroidia bacterium]